MLTREEKSLNYRNVGSGGWSTRDARAGRAEVEMEIHALQVTRIIGRLMSELVDYWN